MATEDHRSCLVQVTIWFRVCLAWKGQQRPTSGGKTSPGEALREMGDGWIQLELFPLSGTSGKVVEIFKVWGLGAEGEIG